MDDTTTAWLLSELSVIGDVQITAVSFIAKTRENSLRIYKSIQFLSEITLKITTLDFADFFYYLILID